MKTNSSLKNKRIYVAGHKGLLGSAICRDLKTKGVEDLIVADRQKLDLLNQEATDRFLSQKKPELVIIAAAKVGGILANSRFGADFIYENLQIQNNLIWASHKHDIQKLIFIGSSCIYPKAVPQPMKEDALLSDYLEPTNRPYAVAKIAGLEMVNALREQYGREYFSVMPTNLYGPGDHFSRNNSHVIPGLLRRFHEAKINHESRVEVWGSGKPLREFMFVDDCAEAISFLAENINQDFFERVSKSAQKYYHVNVGSGAEVSIGELVAEIKQCVDYRGEVGFDSSMPDGVRRKKLDLQILEEMGWRAKTQLREGLCETYDWLVNHSLTKPTPG